MKIISHRGNINGPILDKENRPSYIDSAIQLGYEVEVDLRYINNEFWLGHDIPQYRIEIQWMELRRENIWFHCKDINSAIELTKLDNKYKFFCHTQDDYVITSNNKLWVHNLSNIITNECIIPLIELLDINNYTNDEPYAICTDYVFKCNNTFRTIKIG